MPYIEETEREYFKEAFSELARTGVQTVGELNFVLTKVCLLYLNQLPTEKYQYYNDVIGALECCKLEMYRRKISDYEDKKVKENGDVY